MIRVEAVCRAVPGVDLGDLTDWIARGWVAPGGEPPDWVFAEVDVARVRLVRDLRVEAGIEADTLAVVLSLVDQVYDLRRALRTVMGAVAEQPAPVRDAVAAALRE